MVTGHGADRRSAVLIDAPSTRTANPMPGLEATLLWCTDQMPAAIPIGTNIEDMGDRIVGTQPPPNGTRFAILELAPGAQTVRYRTDTIGYVILLSGELDFEVDNETISMQAGDCLVQRGTYHVWSNGGVSAAKVAVVTVEAEPLDIVNEQQADRPGPCFRREKCVTGRQSGAPRRIVTGHDQDTRSSILLDGPAANTRSSMPGVSATLLWCTDRMPADNAIGRDVEDMGARIIGTAPPLNGTRFAIVEIAPGVRTGMHRTETIDYIVVLSGELELELDCDMVSLKAGDTVVQRGTDHIWENKGSIPVRAAVITVDAEPLGIGYPVPRTKMAG